MTVEFYPLEVTVHPETDESVALTFHVPDELSDTFGHLPGQHLVLRAEVDGVETQRSYSICSPSGAPNPTVGIKRIPDGVFSTWATTKLRDGDVVEVMAPIGEFVHRIDPAATAKYVAIAAGSGITPILSIVGSILEQEPHSDVTLVYGNRTSRSVMFLEAVEALKDRFPQRFQVLHILSREPNAAPLLEGRIDADKIKALASTLISTDTVDSWFVCGPLDLVETVEATLGALGVDRARIHKELFFDQRIEPIAELQPDENTVELTFTLNGRTSSVHVDPDGPALLDYARTVRSEVPFACKGGMCASCKARVIEGEVGMDKNYALTSDEVGAGYVLTCQSHTKGDVVLTYDLHAGPS